MQDLTAKQIALFEELNKSRTEDFKTFSKKNYRGVWASIIDKYPETAHFIYELLQNADDACATKVEISVSSSEMQFKHNGTKHFNITKIDGEIEGDISAITGIGDSTKEELHNKIGKFGVGFKAVFQYTNTPEIYDDIFKFKIENYIIPVLLGSDHPERKKGETLFVFPLKDSQKSYKDIVNRIENLQSPILFLNNLEEITLTIKKKSYVYKKEILSTIQYDDGITFREVVLTSPKDLTKIFLFSKDEVIKHENSSHTHAIHVGFYYDEEKQRLVTNIHQPVFCFFPTKENFKTCYVCHAPFLLTDNRQNLKPSEEVNELLLKSLGNLAAHAVLHLRDYGFKNKTYLINENILDIYPRFTPSWTSSYDGRSHYREVYEGPIQESFDSILGEERIYLSRNNKYLTSENAYLGSPKELIDLLTPKQLRELIETEDKADFLKWEIIKRVNNSEDEFNDLLYNDFSSTDLAQEITPEFMEKQDIKWVSKMYTFLRSAAPKLWKFSGNELKKENAYLPFRKAPIIKTQNGQWVAPYTNNTTPNVFLPIDGKINDEYNFINEEYLKDEMCKKFFNELEICEPNEMDYIRQVIVKRYENETDLDDGVLLSDMNLILRNYVNNRNNESELVSILEDCLLFVNTNDKLCYIDELFFPNNTLKLFYDEDAFIKESFYKDVINQYGYDVFLDFVKALGINNSIQVEEKKETYYSLSNIFDKELSAYLESFAEGENVVRWTITNYSLMPLLLAFPKLTKEDSIYIWNQFLCKIELEKYKSPKVEYRKKRGRSDWCLYVPQKSHFSMFFENTPWLFNKDGEKVAPKDVVFEDLVYGYNENEDVIHFLGIKKAEINIIELGGTKEQQEDLDFGRRLKYEFGVLSEDDIVDIKKFLGNKRRNIVSLEKTSDLSKLPNEHENGTVEEQDLATILKERFEEKAKRHIGKPHNSKRGNASIEINSTTYNEGVNTGTFFDESKNGLVVKNENDDRDESVVERKLDSKNQKAQEGAKKTEEIKQTFALLKETPKFSYMWYKLLMELMHADKSNVSIRHLQIDFAEKAFKCEDKILHLSNPSKPVPSWILDAEKISISTLSDNPQKIDGIIVKVDDVSVDISIECTSKLKSICNSANKIRIVADNSSNIIDSLETRFLQLGFEDDYDMNANLTKDIDFIYGPPGTGKTTLLVKQVSDILKRNDKKVNILILTPTNKAADVIAEKMVADDMCYNYLTRFGATESLYLIEEVAVVCNRDTTDMDLLEKNVVVTTAARYAYDCVQPNDTFLCDFNWDYIIIDEASMVDIITSTFILYKGAPAKFIISGDPKQIQPVAQNDMPTYNIYDLVGLNDFSEAVNNYTRYKVTTLKTQHRSIPEIGDLVSRFAYNGIVQADPQRVPQKPLSLQGMNVKNINFIGFETIEFDLIKGLTAVDNSAFHLYSAIFTYKFTEYIIKQISANDYNKNYSIGIVSPYKAEADAIKQMLENRPISNDICNVTCGTVHSFQGDECDIMLLVLNPPAICSRGSHINNENIINVAMSRARDYIFFIMPQGQTKGMVIKEQFNSILKNKEKAFFHCSDIEEAMFNDRNHITSNTHVTCHMPVNVYCEENSLYEVRISDDALDIKINE